MTIPNPYFKNVPGFGDLKMEQVIVDYVYPLLSVLRDKKGGRYLCMCFDTRGAQQWLVTPVSIQALTALLKNEVTLSSPFEDPHTLKMRIVMDYHTRQEFFQGLTAKQIPKEELPEPGEYLDAEPGEWAEYIKMLNLAHLRQTSGIGVHKASVHYGGVRGVPAVKWESCNHQHRKEGRYVVCAAG